MRNFSCDPNSKDEDEDYSLKKKKDEDFGMKGESKL